MLSLDTGSMRTASRAITRVVAHDSARICDVQIVGGRTLSTTALHPLLTHRGWIRAGKLRGGDRLVSIDGNDRVVSASRVTDRVEPVFNLYTDGERNFIAEGAVAHNFVVLPALRTVLCRLAGLTAFSVPVKAT